MKKAYWISKYKKINDQEALERYAEKAKKVIELFGEAQILFQLNIKRPQQLKDL